MSAIVSQSASFSLSVPAVGEKVARQSAKDFKANLPATMTPKQKRAAYDEYAAQFSTAGSSAIMAAISSGNFQVKSMKAGKSGQVNVALAPVKEKSPSTVAKLRDEVAELKRQLAAAQSVSI
jgi:hypothetical protein